MSISKLFKTLSNWVDIKVWLFHHLLKASSMSTKLCLTLKSIKWVSYHHWLSSNYLTLQLILSKKELFYKKVGFICWVYRINFMYLRVTMRNLWKGNSSIVLEVISKISSSWMMSMLLQWNCMKATLKT